MDHLGTAIGPVLATLFLWRWPHHLQTLFLLTIIPGLIVVAILIFGLREPKHANQTAQPFALSLAPLSGNFRLYLVSLAVFTLGNSSDLFLLSAPDSSACAKSCYRSCGSRSTSPKAPAT